MEPPLSELDLVERARKERKCLDCGAELTDPFDITSVRCEACAAIIKNAREVVAEAREPHERKPKAKHDHEYSYVVAAYHLPLSNRVVVVFECEEEECKAEKLEVSLEGVVLE